MTNLQDSAAIARDILTRAALVHRFDPLALMPEQVSPEIEAKTLALVAQHASEVEGVDPKNPKQPKTLWRLNPTARRGQLARLVAESGLENAIKQSNPPRDDAFARYLQEALTGKLKPDDVPNENRDTAAVAADFAAEALPSGLRDVARNAADSLRALLSQQADERRSKAILPSKLIGRSAEQAVLNAFVGSGIVPEADRLPEPGNPAIVVRPYLLTGTPGAGKSALVADLVRRRRGYPITDEPFDWSPGGIGNSIGTLISTAASATAEKATAAVAAATRLISNAPEQAPPNAPVVLLDFDRPDIALGGELEWTTETTRQLGFGRPDLAKKLSDMRADVRRRQAQLDPSGKSATAIITATSDMKTELAKELGAAGLAGAILVLVLDTFEEVVIRSSLTDDQISGSLLGRLLIWVDSLATLKSDDIPVFNAVRVVASGREKPDLDKGRLARWFAGHRVIGNLAPDSAVEFLRGKDSQRRFSPKLAREAVEKIGGHPLTLILLELYARNLKPEEIEKTIRDEKIGQIMGSQAATKALYSRFLRRLHHDLELNDGVTAEMVQAVAHPGLVLREITPDILRDVVCPACGLEAISPSIANALFERLRKQIWLIENVPGRNAIRHQSDIRRLMLPMMTGDPDTTATPDDDKSSQQIRKGMLQVHREAAAWYDRVPNAGDKERLEAHYHRAFLPDRSFLDSIASLSPEEAAQLLRRVAESAGEDLRVMPVATRALLRFHSVGPLRMTDEEVAALPEDLRKRAQVERLDLARLQGSTSKPDPDAGLWSAGREAPAPASRGLAAGTSLESLEMTAPAEDGPGSETAEPPIATPVGTIDPSRLFEMVNDRELSTRIGYAFTAGDFDAASSIGWRAIGELWAFPDLTDPLRFSEDPVTHWFWQSALATLGSNRWPPRERLLEQYLQRFADSVNIRRGEIGAAGLTFAAATTIALGRRPSPETAETTDKLAQIVQRMHEVSTHGDLRLLAMHVLWRRDPWQPPKLEVRIPFNRIQLFSKDVLGTSPNHRPGFEMVWKFIAKARDGKISSREADAFAMSSEDSLFLTGAMFSNPSWHGGIGPFLTGVTPEVYDSAVRALVDSDNLSYGAVDRAIEVIAERALFWPADLVPGDIPSRDHDRRAGLLARVVLHADRCGLLASLFDEARTTNASKHLPRLAQLIRHYEEVRCLGYSFELAS